MKIYQHPNRHLTVKDFNTVGAKSYTCELVWELLSEKQVTATQLPHDSIHSTSASTGNDRDRNSREEEATPGEVAFANLALFFRLLNHFQELYRPKMDRQF